MTCNYDEAAVVTISWDKDTTSVTPGDTCDCDIVANGQLRLNNVSAMDSGEYTCYANIASFPRCSATLRLAGERGRVWWVCV